MKRYAEFAIALLLSIAIWLIYNLSGDATAVVSVPVSVSSNMQGCAARASETVSVAAVCTGSGFGLMRASSRSRKPVQVFVDASWISNLGDGFYNVSSEGIFNYASDIFGKDLAVQSLVSQNIRLQFAPENYKTVPLDPVTSISYKPQYTAFGPLQLSMDSVLVYGTPERLSAIDKVITEPIRLRKLSRGVHGVVRLRQPEGTRLSSEQVSYGLEVTRYVEISSSAKVEVRGVPYGSEVGVYPSTVEVLYRCTFPVVRNPEESAVLYVDYSEFKASASGKCRVAADNLPAGVISYSITPQLCECVELQ